MVKSKSEKNKEYLQKYFKTIQGVGRKLYHHMKERSKSNGWKFDFSYDDFCEWLYKTDYKTLYDAWVSSGYEQNLKPSIDRIDEHGIYEFSNMRVITWVDNWLLGQQGGKNKAAYTKSFSEYNKKQQYDFIIVKGDTVIDVCNNQTHAAEKHGLNRSHINSCLLNNRNTHKGFRFYIIGGVIAR